MNTINPSENQISFNTQARIAGFNFLFAMGIVIFGQFYLSSDLIVPGNSLQTAMNIIAHETKFRIWIVCNLLYVTNIIVLLSMLYFIFKPVSNSLAMIAAIFRIVYALLWVVIVFNMLGTLRFLNDPNYLKVSEADRLQILTRLPLGSNLDAYYVGLPFYAIASTICSYLWFKSGYLHKVLAVFGIMASAWCIFCGLAYISFLNFDKTINLWWFDTPMGIFELILGFILLLKGIKIKENAKMNV